MAEIEAAASAVNPEAASPAVRRAVVLQPARMQLAEYQRSDWVVTAELGTTPQDIQSTGYFSHMAEQLKPYDHIEVRIDDGSWLANLVVLQTDRNWARVKMVSFVQLIDDVDPAPASKTNSVEFKGPHHKWCVIRLQDSEKIKVGCQSRHEAEAWMREHEKVA